MCNEGMKQYLILQGLHALSKCLEEDQLQVTFGGSDEVDCVVVPRSPFKMGLALASLYHNFGGIHHQIRSPLPAKHCMVATLLRENEV